MINKRKRKNMANVINKTTFKYLRSVNTPDYPEEDWVINPDVSDLENREVPQIYWKVVENSEPDPDNEGQFIYSYTVEEMTAEEKAARDAFEENIHITNIKYSPRTSYSLVFADSSTKIVNKWMNFGGASGISSNESPALLTSRSKLVGIQITNATNDADILVEIYSKDGLDEDTKDDTTLKTKNGVLKASFDFKGKNYSNLDITPNIVFERGETIAVYVGKNGAIPPSKMVVILYFSVIYLAREELLIDTMAKF